MEQQTEIPSVLTVNQFSKKHPAFPQGGMRHRIFHSATNGMDDYDVILRAGRKVLIDEQKFFEWLKASQTFRKAG